MTITVNGSTNTITAPSGLTIAGNTAVTGTLSASGDVTFTGASVGVLNVNATGANVTRLSMINGGGQYFFGVNDSAGSGFGGTAYSQVIYAPAGRVVETSIAGTGVITKVSSTGLAVTGTLSATGNTTVSRLFAGGGTTNWPTTSIGSSAGRHILNGSTYPMFVLWNEEAASVADKAALYIGAKTGAGATTIGGGRSTAGLLSASDYQGYMDFQATNSAGFFGTPAIRISGKSTAAQSAVLIGTTTDDGSNLLQVAGAAKITGHTTPGADNTYNLGSAALGWKELFCDNGTINTSDARRKTEVSALSAAEINAAKQLAKEIGSFKFLAAVAEKGDAARLHIGMTVQRAIEIMESNGLNPFAYSFICHDAWDQQVIEHAAVEAKDAVLDDDGSVVEPAVEAKGAWTEVTLEAGDKYSFRAHELLLFMAAGFEARLSALEAA